MPFDAGFNLLTLKVTDDREELTFGLLLFSVCLIAFLFLIYFIAAFLSVQLICCFFLRFYLFTRERAGGEVEGGEADSSVEQAAQYRAPSRTPGS